MLKGIQSSLPPSERKIATYIIENPHESVGCTAMALGKRSQTSSAAVIRLCKSLGLKGFQELKLRVAGDLQRPEENDYRDIYENESHLSIISKITNNSIQTLRETAEILNTDELAGAVQAFMQAKTIHFFGVAASGMIAQDAQQKFLRIDKQATAFSDTHIVAMLAANVSVEDVVMGISFSGETEEVVKILDLANKKGATTVSLTRYGPFPVSERADYKLYTSASKEATFRSGATSSRLAQLHVIDILFMSVAAQQYEQSVEYLDQTRAAVDTLKDKNFLPKEAKNKHQ